MSLKSWLRVWLKSEKVSQLWLRDKKNTLISNGAGCTIWGGGVRVVSKLVVNTGRELAESLALFVVVFLAARHFELFELLYDATRSYEDWEIDELILVLIAVPLPLSWFAYRKSKDLSKETVSKRRLEEAIVNSDKMKSLGVLAGGVAHEINNQLHPILSMAELVRDHMDTSHKDYRKMEIILKSAHNARDTVSKILYFSRNEGQVSEICKVSTAWCALEPILRTLCPANITLGIRTVIEDGVIRMSDADLHSVIINLMSNSIDAIEDKAGVVTIEAYTKSHVDAVAGDNRCGDLIISFLDTGPGIAPGLQKQVFDPFFTTKVAGQGVGLGLSIIYFSVNEAGGSIEIDPNVKGGCHFNISIPLYRE